MTFLLLALLFVAILASNVPDRHSSVDKASLYEVCKTTDKAACSGRGQCQAYARSDGRRGTRCVCQEPYVGTKCESKKVEQAPKKLQAQQKKLVDPYSSSSSSSSDVDEELSSDFDDEDLSASSEVEDDEGEWSDSGRSGRGRHHHRTNTGQTFAWWVVGSVIFIVLICCCLGGLVYWNRRI